MVRKLNILLLLGVYMNTAKFLTLIKKLNVSNWDKKVLFLTLISIAQFANATDPRSKPEGTFESCIDCVVNSQNYGTDNMTQLHDVAIFTKDPSRKKFEEPREEFFVKDNPQLNAIGIVEVFGNSNVPPRKDKANSNTDDEIKFKPGPQKGVGSGFMINECLFITNHHVGYLKRDPKNVENIKVRVSVGSSGNPNSPFAITSDARILDSIPFTDNGDNERDLVIMKLDQPIADPENPNDPRHAWKIPVVQMDFKKARAEETSSASFYRDIKAARSGTQLWGQKECSILSDGQGVNKGAWSTDCPSLPGASGSPILSSRKMSNGSTEIFAIGIIQGSRSPNKTENLLSPSTLNNMIPFSNALPDKKLKELMKKNPCTKNLSA